MTSGMGSLPREAEVTWIVFGLGKARELGLSDSNWRRNNRSAGDPRLCVSSPSRNRSPAASRLSASRHAWDLQPPEPRAMLRPRLHAGPVGCSGVLWLPARPSPGRRLSLFLVRRTIAQGGDIFVDGASPGQYGRPSVRRRIAAHGLRSMLSTMPQRGLPPALAPAGRPSWEPACLSAGSNSSKVTSKSKITEEMPWESSALSTG